MKLSSNPQLERWHRIVLKQDQQDLLDFLAENSVFHSPYLEQPYYGREAVWRILTAVSTVFQGFTYQRELIDNSYWALEFSARVGDQLLKGIDLIRLNEDNLIEEFEVFIRPMNGLRALGFEMAKRLS